MKKIILAQTHDKHITKEVAAVISEEADLSEILYTVEGLIRSLGYHFDGSVGIKDDDE